MAQDGGLDNRRWRLDASLSNLTLLFEALWVRCRALWQFGWFPSWPLVGIIAGTKRLTLNLPLLLTKYL